VHPAWFKHHAYLPDNILDSLDENRHREKGSQCGSRGIASPPPISLAASESDFGAQTFLDRRLDTAAFIAMSCFN
jgi:hypothetical protein